MARRFMVEDCGQVSFVHRLAASRAGVEMSALQGRLAAQALTDMTKSGIEHGSLLLLGDSTLGDAIWFRGVEFAAARPAWGGERGSQAR